MRLNTPTDPNTNPTDNFLASVNDLFENMLQDVGDADMVGVDFHNKVNQSDRPIGISFRQRNQLSGDVIWSVFEKVSQSNSRFNALDALTVVVHSARMPVGFGFPVILYPTRIRPGAALKCPRYKRARSGALQPFKCTFQSCIGLEL